MTDDNAVKENAGSAADQGEVNNNGSTASGIPTDDLLAVIDAKDAELVKIRSERDNYKKGMLKAKGKLDDDSDDEESSEDKMRRIVREENLASRESELVNQKDTAIKALAKRNKELELLVKNRSQIGGGEGAGNSTETQPIADSHLSIDQVKNLKAKGWSDEKIELFKKNLMKNRG